MIKRRSLEATHTRLELTFSHSDERRVLAEMSDYDENET